MSRMSGSSGGAAKVDTKQQKKENHAMWKALMCGLAREKSQNSVALLSESTGIRNRGLEDAVSAPSTAIAAGLNSLSAAMGTRSFINYLPSPNNYRWGWYCEFVLGCTDATRPGPCLYSAA